MPEESLLALLIWNEVDREGRGIFRGFELFIAKQQPNGVNQGTCLPTRVAEPFVDLQCFFRSLFPSLVASWMRWIGALTSEPPESYPPLSRASRHEQGVVFVPRNF